jgi:type IV secretion system protein VirD4
MRAESRGQWLLKTSVLAIAAVLASQYLAGYLFLWSLHVDPHAASPLTVARYGYWYGDRATIRRRLLGASGVGLALVIVPGVIVLLPRRRSLHGDARFARRAEIRAAGLLGHEGIILSARGGRCLMLAGQQGVALAAPPRAGKGTGIVIPNALNWAGSLVCVDIKRENWTLTAGYRAACGQACFLFDPFAEDGRTARWNPFSYVSADPVRRLNDLQRIAEMLYPDPPNVDPFWTASARSLFLGIALYLFDTPTLPRTIGEVLRQGMASDDEGFGQHWKRLIEGRKAGPRPLSAQCVRALYDIIDLAPVTASSIRKTFTSRLDLWLNPILDAATAESDFDLRELRKKPLSIYVSVNPDDLHRLRPVLNLFFQQAIGLQTRELPEQNPALRYQVLMLLDEFTALGRIPIIAEAISYLPGYNVRVLLVIQTPAQLREVYGLHNSEVMLKSLAARIVFAPKDHADAREISDELGFTTVKVKTVSRSAGQIFDSRGRRSTSHSLSQDRRALMLPQELKELGTEEAIIFYEGLRPIRCRKIRYFAESDFRRRVLPPPSEPKPRGPRLPKLLASHESEPVTRVEASPPDRRPEQRRASRSSSTEIEEIIVMREVTADDIERMEALALTDFEKDYSAVFAPDTPGPLSDAELSAGTLRFMTNARRAV